MNPQLHFSFIRVLALAGCSFFAAGSFAGSDAMSSAQARYQQDRAACMSGHTYEDQKTCLKEAGAAYDEAKRGQLNGASTQLARNALKRCEGLPERDRQDCVARIKGDHTTVSGSVAGGGEVRERVTTEVVRP